MNRSNFREGSYLVLFLPLIFSIFIFGFLFINIGEGLHQRNRASELAHILISGSLQMHVEALEKMGERLQNLDHFVSQTTPTEALVLSSRWNSLEAELLKIKNALPGYKGRLKSVRTVLCEANQVDLKNVTVVQDGGLTVGLSPVDQWVRDEKGNEKKMKTFWYKRLWAPEEKNGEPFDEGAIEIRVTSPLLGGPGLGISGSNWEIVRAASGRLRWDGFVDNSSDAGQRDGGYPRNWEEAREGIIFHPYRIPLYSWVVEEGS
jgi:hypothetical protein